jgi:hypothetical protein
MSDNHATPVLASFSRASSIMRLAVALLRPL